MPRAQVSGSGALSAVVRAVAFANAASALPSAGSALTPPDNARIVQCGCLALRVFLGSEAMRGPEVTECVCLVIRNPHTQHEAMRVALEALHVALSSGDLARESVLRSLGGTAGVLALLERGTRRVYGTRPIEKQEFSHLVVRLLASLLRPTKHRTGMYGGSTDIMKKVVGAMQAHGLHMGIQEEGMRIMRTCCLFGDASRYHSLL